MTPTRQSYRARIDAKCRDCVYDPYAVGTWRKQVEQCGGVNCALYPVRPVPSARAV